MPKSKRYLIILIALSLLPLWPFIKPGIFGGHDIVSHLVRVASFTDSLREGHLVPRWSKDLNAGFGHPIFMFLYPLPNYLASLFHFSGASIVFSLKLVFGLSFVFSGVFSFLWLKKLFGEKAALVGALFYLFGPYRFVDMYIRAALGECLAFMFVPLVFYFLERLSKKRDFRFLVGGSFSLAGLILSHNAISLMFMPLIGAYILFLVWSERKQRALFAAHCLLFIIFGFSLSAFFWLPSLYEGKYTLRDIVISPEEVLSRFPEAKELFLPPSKIFGVERKSNNLSFYLGFPQILSLFLAPCLILKLRRKKSALGRFLLFCLLLYLVTVFLLLGVSKPVWKTVTLLQKFQFPWRFLALTSFLPAVFGASLTTLLKNKSLVLILTLMAVFSTYSFWQPVGYFLPNEQDLIKNYVGTTDTGENTPRWSIRGMGERAKRPMEIIEGEAEIEVLERVSTKHLFEVKAREKTRLVDNTLYFPGWWVLVDGQETEIEFQDPSHRGLITFWVEPGAYQVEVVFKETQFRFFSDLISLIGLGGLAFIGIIRKRVGLA